ncbi:MAG TPA: MFS transporter [Thermoplasmata archaeon]|nr:MFS transporter [Thermoplasmata archaeon]
MVSARPGGYLQLLRDRRFRYYWLSQAAGDAGYAVYAISVVWLGYRISGSALVVGVLLGVEFSVYALSFLAGAVIDRVRDLRSVLVVGYPVQAAGAFTLGLLLATGRLDVPILLVLVALISLMWDFTWTANNAIPPHLVEGDELLRANGLIGAASGGSQIGGYAAGGTLLLIVGPATGQFLYGALNLVALVLVLPLAVPQVGAAAGDFVERLRGGWRYLASAAGGPLRQLTVYSSVQGIVSLAPPLLITLLSARYYTDPAATYSLLFASFAVGGVAGSLVLGAWNPRRRLATVLLGGTALEGLLILGAVLSVPLIVPSALAWFAVGMGDIALWTVLLAYVQASTPKQLLGRTITNAYFFRGVTRAGGVVALGVLGTLVLPATLAWIVGVTFLAIALVASATMPALRRLAY